MIILNLQIHYSNKKSIRTFNRVEHTRIINDFRVTKKNTIYINFFFSMS